MLARLPAAALRSRHQPHAPLSLAQERLALVVSRVLSPEACATIATNVDAASAELTPNFDGVQHTLGLAYYTHLEEDRVDEYFAGAERSHALVERVAPGMSARLLTLVSEVVQAEVVQRDGWCGPGIHVFPAQGWVAERGGDVHFDLEGLDDAQLATRQPALSLVLGLRAPESGGGLRLWPRTWAHGVAEAADGEPTLLPLVPGDVVVFDSYRLHQIEPFEGGIDRLTATVHALRGDDGRWLAWF
jgi:hypothetical protein